MTSGKEEKVAATVTHEEYKSLERSLREKILEKAANDPEWRQQYVEDPEQALQQSGIEEAQRIREVHEALKPFNPEEEEVQGHDYAYYYEICYNYTTYYEWQYYYLDT
jgi:hypothetical protein